jgi:intracellular septation protein
MSPKASKHFFLLSFLPAILYWYLETQYPVKIAVIGGVGLSLLELTIEKIWIKKVHQLSVFNFILLLILGVLSYLADEGIWFKLQPFFTGIGVSAYLFFKLKHKKGLLKGMLHELNPQVQVPDWILDKLESNIAWFLLLHAILMGALALWSSTGIWAFFKTTGIYIVFVPFLLAHMIWIRHKLKAIHRQQMMLDILKNQKIKYHDQRGSGQGP